MRIPAFPLHVTADRVRYRFTDRFAGEMPFQGLLEIAGPLSYPILQHQIVLAQTVLKLLNLQQVAHPQQQLDMVKDRVFVMNDPRGVRDGQGLGRARERGMAQEELVVHGSYGDAEEVLFRCGARTGERMAMPTPGLRIERLTEAIDVVKGVLGVHREGASDAVK